MRVPSASSTPFAVQLLDGRHDLDPAVLDRLDHLLVDDGRGHAQPQQPAEDALLGLGQAELREVAELAAADEGDHPVGPPRAELHHQPGHQRTGGIANEDVRRGAHGQPHPPRAARYQVVGDLHARGARPRHQHVGAEEGSRVSVGAGVQQPALVAIAARPRGDELILLVAGGDDHLIGPQIAVRRPHQPAGAVAVQALHPRPQAHVEPVVGRVVLEIAHDLVAAGEHGRALGVAASGQLREGAAGVQAQAVVAVSP